MSRASNGNYALPAGNPVIPSTVIESAWANNTLNDLAEAMTDSLSRTGKGVMQADLVMGGYKVSGVAAATESADAPTALQIRNMAFSWLFPVSSDVGGNVYAGTAILPDAPVAGTGFLFFADKTNTSSTITLSVNGGAALPLLVNGAPPAVGLVLPGTVLSVMFYANTYRVLGGISGDNLGISSLVSSDPAVISGTLVNKVLTVIPHTNVANGMAKLGPDGLLPISIIPSTGLKYIGNWNAAPGTNPAPAATTGDFYLISTGGTLTLYRSSTPPAFTPQATVVAPNDQIIWQTPGTVNQPQGWYYQPGAASVVATNVGMTATPAFPTATNAQAWMNQVDPYLGTLLPKSGGTMTGQLILNGAPSTALTAANRQYVDDAVAGVPTGVETFNTRSGDVVLTDTDVTDALGYVPVDPAGGTFTGPVTGTNFYSKGFIQTPYAANITGAMALDVANGQSQQLTCTGATSIASISNVAQGNIIRLVFKQTDVGAITSWPANVRWPTPGTVPDLAAGASKKAIVVFESDGSHLLGNVAVY